MKELLSDKNVPDSVWNSIKHETPFKVVSFGPYELRLFWVSPRGMYGPQVLAVAYGSHGYCWSDKTGGCGYSKECAAMESFWRACGYHPRANDYFHSEIHHSYRKGGNYYKVPKRDILRNKRG